MSFYSDFAQHYEAVFPFREPVLSFLTARLPPGGARVLDLGCGTGHYAGRLAAAGHDVVGLDLDPAMIAAAARAYPAARFVESDLLELDRIAGPFAVVCCLGNVLSHVPSARLPELVAKVREALLPGGAWLFQTVNWDHVLARGGADYRFPDRTLPDGTRFTREYRDVSAASVRFVTRLAGERGEFFHGEVELYPAAADEYRRLHAAAGLHEAGHWGDFSGAPFRADAEGGSVFDFRRS